MNKFQQIKDINNAIYKLVKESSGSLFSKDDVLNLLNQQYEEIVDWAEVWQIESDSNNILLSIRFHQLYHETETLYSIEMKFTNGGGSNGRMDEKNLRQMVGDKIAERIIKEAAIDWKEIRFDEASVIPDNLEEVIADALCDVHTSDYITIEDQAFSISYNNQVELEDYTLEVDWGGIAECIKEKIINAIK